jgi:GcrA cell cycle regulator
MQPSPRISPAERLAAERKATIPQQHEGGWTPERVDLLRTLWSEGNSASECAMALGGGITRSAVTGKVARMKLVQGKTIRAKAPVVEAKSEALPDVLPEDGVDVTHLVGVMDLTGNTCRWPHGDPLLPGFGFCGRPPQENSPYCPEHHRRSYPARATLA